MIRRDRHDITLDILKCAKTSVKKTYLMRKVGLTSRQTKRYITMLSNHGLIKVDIEGNYKTTEKGLEFLSKCRKCPLFKWD